MVACVRCVRLPRPAADWRQQESPDLMKVTIYGDVRGSPDTHKMWEGELSALPRPEDFISLHDDYGAYIVRNVLISAPTNEAEIKVWINSVDDIPPTS